MASNGKEAEFHEGIKNNASIVNASPTLIVSKNVDGTYEHTLPGNIPLTSAQITTALGYAPIGANTSITGLTQGAVISINTDTAKFNISAGTGFIVNGNISVPTVTPVTITASTANVIPNLGTQEITYVAISVTGALYLTNEQLTATERRSYIRLGRIVHSNNTSINAIYNQPTVNKEAGGQIQDILEAFGFRSLSGNRIFPVSTNLKIKKEVGRVFKSGSNFATLATQPHSFTLAALDPITFKYRTQTGVEGAAVTDIDPDIYDVNGTVTPVGSTATLATIQRIFVSQSNEVRIQPGQRVFTTLNGAVTAINSDVFVTDSDIFDNFLYLGAIVLTRNTVNLADIAQAIFVPSIGVCANGTAPVPGLGYTAEDQANKQNNLAADGTGARYTSVDAVNDGLALKQDNLVSGTNIKTINGATLLGSGDIVISGGGGTNTVNLTGDQTIAGVKTFSSDVKVNTLTLGKGGGGISTNTALGSDALTANTTGDSNTSTGDRSLGANTIGSRNSGYGFTTLQKNTTGQGNSAFGSTSSRDCIVGNFNSSFGGSALQLSTNSNNTAFGYDSLSQLVTGEGNIAVGSRSGYKTGGNIIASQNSIFIGRECSPLATGQSNQIVVGNVAVGLGSNTSVVGNTSTVFARIWGRNLVGTSTDNGVDALQVNGTVNATINSYANDAAADADTNLKSNTFYKITGSRVIYQKP